MMRDRAQPPALFERAGDTGKKKTHELHRSVTCYVLNAESFSSLTEAGREGSRSLGPGSPLHHWGAAAASSTSGSSSSTQGIRPEAGAGPLTRLHSLHNTTALDGATQSGDGAFSARLHSSQISDGFYIACSNRKIVGHLIHTVCLAHTSCQAACRRTRSISSALDSNQLRQPAAEHAPNRQAVGNDSRKETCGVSNGVTLFPKRSFPGSRKIRASFASRGRWSKMRGQKGGSAMSAEQIRRDSPEESVPPPTGTVFVMGLYLLVLIVAWSAMFWLLAEK
jgi:hypothetical protein